MSRYRLPIASSALSQYPLRGYRAMIRRYRTIVDSHSERRLMRLLEARRRRSAVCASL